MKAITKGILSFHTELAARQWLSAKVMDPSFTMGRIIEPALGSVWRVEWGERNEEKVDA